MGKEGKDALLACFGPTLIITLLPSVLSFSFSLPGSLSFSLTFSLSLEDTEILTRTFPRQERDSGAPS
jgi:hypothetical protein